MSKALITEQYLTDIADAIRGKLGVQTQYKPSEMADAIESISGGGGGANVSTGTFVSSDTQYGIVSVNCGFKPDLVIVKLPFDGVDTTSYWWCDASWADEYAIWNLHPAEGSCYMIELGRESGETGIQQINNNGFSFMSNGGNTLSITCGYVAIKYTS